MSLTTDSMGVADLAAVVDNNRNNGFFGGDGLYAIIVLFILMAMMGNGWGNGFGGGFGGGGMYPWLNMGQNNIDNGVQRGFDQSALMGAINGVNASVNAINPQLCNGFAGVNATINSGFANAETAANARQMAGMNQAFAAQTAMGQGFNAVQSQLAECCCSNQLATANLTGVVQTEAAANRYADANNTRDIIENCNRNNQAVLDKLCALELDGVKAQLATAERENVALQNQLNMATMQASQTAQTAQILADNARQTTALEQYLNPAPIPAYPVQNPNCCGTWNYGCGCGA